MRIMIIGCGRWGINHVKTAYSLLGNNFTVCDFNESARDKIANISSEIEFTTDLDSKIKSADIDAVIIATPAETHFDIAKKCLQLGKDVLVEKPITLKSIEAKELINIANENSRKLMVGHVLLYHPAVRLIKELIGKGKIGKLQYIYSNRLNLGAIRSEENILWSFAPHDISVIQYLTESNPVSVKAMGSQIVQNYIEDSTITYLVYPNNIHAHIFVSWLHPFKEQRMVVIGDDGILVFEDSLPEKKLKFYPKGFHKVHGRLEKFEGDCQIIDFPQDQPLTLEHQHFYECISNRTNPLTDGMHALQVLEILEKASSELCY